MKVISKIALFGAVALVGCENMGLEYAGAAEEARVNAPTDLVAAVHPRVAESEVPPLIVDGTRWVTAGEAPAVGEEDVRPVGSASGTTVYARSWDSPPYDQLFTRVPGSLTAGDGWRSYLPVIGDGGASGGADGHEDPSAAAH
jgi:hypothetical protein